MKVDFVAAVPQSIGLARFAKRPLSNVSLMFLKRALRLVGERRRQLSRGEIGLDAAFKAHELAVASRFHGEVDLVRRAR